MDNSNSVEKKNNDLERVLRREELTLEDVKVALRIVRYDERGAEITAHADTLLHEAGDYLPPYILRALVRADIDEDEGARYLERNKAFFSRLAELLPSLIGFFNRRDNLYGILSCIDDCHNDFYAATTSPRKDRQLRETKELIANSLETAVKAVTELEKASRHFTVEYSRYREIYYPEERPRHLDELIGELKVCSGVLEIVSAAVDLNPKFLILSGNDQRKSLVEWAYHMCTMWDGPKLVTTPGSQFAALCSLLFEAMCGEADEGLAGAINRYARSDERKEWDEQGEEQLADDDNFASEKHAIRFSEREIELCEALLDKARFSTTAEILLQMRIKRERQNRDEARSKYGPRQVYMSQLNPDQIDAMLGEAIGRLSPEKLEKLSTHVGQSSAALDISLGEARRSARRQGFDA
jgi:hypothetical protein